MCNLNLNYNPQMASGKTLYQSISKIREEQNQPHYRLMVCGYLNQEALKRQSTAIDAYLKQSFLPYKDRINGYLYIKGVFYIHILESKDMRYINAYLSAYWQKMQQKPLHNQVRIVYQSYQNPTQLFRIWQCDNNVQPGPILSQTDKQEQQITDRMFQIYDLFIEGAKKKKQNPSHKIGTMILLSSDDMSVLMSSIYMSLEEYVALYLEDMEIDRQEESNYPLPPSIFDVIEYLEVEDYEKFANR